ncbi:hypothetical protein OGH69_02950 [Flavobacterium sp. MFBS3-15]|uniref:hypothetical protein n=1 Tax=Flavobacterium sp. MFBS3-15 TaxID=2989816 RepID=UPI002235EBBF|nr:hypothetical protein [Flavobacterium sp. MFBS3-15]MCW4467911.1 hypothetical protein [Flavobacterium sp. MFBS3-15]
MRKIVKYYYTGYYKFFKLWQSDIDSARNAKGMIALIILLVWLGIFGKLYKIFISAEPLDLGGKYKPLGYLISLPLIIIIMSSIKSTYPNDIKRNWVRTIIVSFTIPMAIIIMILLLKS